MKKMQLLTDEILRVYNHRQKFMLKKHLDKLANTKRPAQSFITFSQEASVYSSQIEGSTVTENDYSRYKTNGVGKGTNRISEVQDLENAYVFCKLKAINATNICKAHTISTKTILKSQPGQRGKLRKQNVRVGNIFTTTYYCPDFKVSATEFAKLCADIKTLNSQKLSITEAFYYASLIHFMYVKIHPFTDGNGRTARLLEKWFLSKHIGSVAWYIRSEKDYANRRKLYYSNLTATGKTYNDMDMKQATDFLLMLPYALRNSY